MEKRFRKSVDAETFIFLAAIAVVFGTFGINMGFMNMMQTMLATAYDLLMNTCFNIMAIAVVAGALSAAFSEFGVIALLDKLITPVMKPVYDLPGAAALGVLTTYMSDNPAILPLADDMNFRKYFKKYQLPALTNLGTAFGLGLIVSAFMLTCVLPDENVGLAVVIGNIGAVIGSIVSVRIMLIFTKKEFGTEEYCLPHSEGDGGSSMEDMREIRSGSAFGRLLGSLMDGGKSGVHVGLAIIPGILVVCTLVMMLTDGPGPGGVYTGAAYEGIGLIPLVGEKLEFILKPLFGFTSVSAISIPITALGSAGAAAALVPEMVNDGIAHANDIAVFTAMCMCWSGYLGTHVSMMTALKLPHLSGRAIFSHTIGGLCAGIAANLLYNLIV